MLMKPSAEGGTEQMGTAVILFASVEFLTMALTCLLALGRATWPGSGAQRAASLFHY